MKNCAVCTIYGFKFPENPRNTVKSGSETEKMLRFIIVSQQYHNPCYYNSITIIPQKSSAVPLSTAEDPLGIIFRGLREARRALSHSRHCKLLSAQPVRSHR